MLFNDSPAVEAYELDGDVDAMRRGHKPYFVRLERDSGNVLECYVADSSYGFSNRDVGVDINRNIYAHVFAESDAHAANVANEQRIMFLAKAGR